MSEGGALILANNTGCSHQLWRRAAVIASILCLSFVLASCASTGPDEETYDPLLKANRGIYKFNDVIDTIIVEPLATGYVKVTPKPVRTSVSNFFDNASYAGTILSDFLQGKGKQGVRDTSRFLVNSTLGLAGLFDPATGLGLKKHDEDFGQTLGVWGANQGAYLVLPLLGPNTVRDTPDLAVSTATSGLFWAGFYVSAAVTIPVGILAAIDERARAENSIRFVNEMALDPYLFTREAWTQHRTFLIHDGNPPVPEFDDEFGEPGEDTF